MRMPQLVQYLTMTALIIYSCTYSSCTKNRPCRDCLIEDPNPIDTIKIDSTLNIGICNTCDSSKPLNLNSWSFRNYNSFVCGKIENSNSFRTESTIAIDFWGPLNCSKDTILSIGVSFESPFNSDQYNVTSKSSKTNLVLQDQLTYTDPWNGRILRTYSNTPSPSEMKVVVDTFIRATGLMVGRFYGYAYTRTNAKSYVDGKFRLLIK